MPGTFGNVLAAMVTHRSSAQKSRSSGAVRMMSLSLIMVGDVLAGEGVRGVFSPSTDSFGLVVLSRIPILLYHDFMLGLWLCPLDPAQLEPVPLEFDACRVTEPFVRLPLFPSSQ